MTTKPQYVYTVGDRVAERPKTHGLLAVRKESQDIVARYRSQRYGTVLAFKEKFSSNGKRQKFLVIQWDHLQSPTEHAQMRICPETELRSMMKTVLVPGE